MVLAGSLCQTVFTKTPVLQSRGFFTDTTRLADFISNGDYAIHLRKLRVAIQQQNLSYQNYLTKNLPVNSKISDPSGGFVLWIQIPKLNGAQLLKQANKHNIDIRIGENFSTRDLYQDYFRLNVGFAINNDKYIQEEVDKQLKKLMLLINDQLK